MGCVALSTLVTSLTDEGYLVYLGAPLGLFWLIMLAAMSDDENEESPHHA